MVAERRLGRPMSTLAASTLAMRELYREIDRLRAEKAKLREQLNRAEQLLGEAIAELKRIQAMVRGAP